MNTDNLLLLAERLEKLPANYNHFNMNDYINRNLDPGEITKKVLHNCGTVACAVGHAPTIRGLNARKDENWEEYSERIFGFDFYSRKFDFAFGGDWADEGDPRHHTAHAAAKRIRLLVERGVPSRTNWLDYIDA